MGGFAVSHFSFSLGSSWLRETYPRYFEKVKAAVAEEIIAGKLANSILGIELDFTDRATALVSLENRSNMKRKI